MDTELPECAFKFVYKNKELNCDAEALIKSVSADFFQNKSYRILFRKKNRIFKIIVLQNIFSITIYPNGYNIQIFLRKLKNQQAEKPINFRILRGENKSSINPIGFKPVCYIIVFERDGK